MTQDTTTRAGSQATPAAIGHALLALAGIAVTGLGVDELAAFAPAGLGLAALPVVLAAVVVMRRGSSRRGQVPTTAIGVAAGLGAVALAIWPQPPLFIGVGLLVWAAATVRLGWMAARTPNASS